jgi:cell shape-determining protein MreC
MARKHISVSKRMLFTYFLLGGFIFLFAPQRLTNKLQFAFTRVFSWPLGVGRSITLATNQPVRPRFVPGPLEDMVSRREYNQLLNNRDNLKQQLEQAHQEIKKLSGLRNTFPFERAKWVLAGIITGSIDESRSEFIIDKGQKEGLARGQFVLGDNSIIGTISADVSANHAKVILIGDRTSKIPVSIGQLNLPGLMEGAGGNCAKIRLKPQRQPIKADDNVYVPKKPGLLEAPIITARVSECKKSDESPLLWDITVVPVCDIEKLSDVAIIVMD